MSPRRGWMIFEWTKNNWMIHTKVGAVEFWAVESPKPFFVRKLVWGWPWVGRGSLIGWGSLLPCSSGWFCFSFFFRLSSVWKKSSSPFPRRLFPLRLFTTFSLILRTCQFFVIYFSRWPPACLYFSPMRCIFPVTYYCNDLWLICKCTLTMPITSTN